MYNYHKEIWFFLDHKEAFCAQYPNRYLVIRNRTIVGHFETYSQAFTQSISKYQRFDFYVAYCPLPTAVLVSRKSKNHQLSGRAGAKQENQVA